MAWHNAENIGCRTVGSSFHQGCLTTVAQVAAEASCKQVTHISWRSAPVEHDFAFAEHMAVSGMKWRASRHKPHFLTSVYVAYCRGQTLDAGCRHALLSQLSNISHTHAGWHLLSGKMAVLAAMLERLRPIGDRIVVVSNSTQVLDLIGTLCRERNVSPRHRRGLTASTGWRHPNRRLTCHRKLDILDISQSMVFCGSFPEQHYLCAHHDPTREGEPICACPGEPK